MTLHDRVISWALVGLFTASILVAAIIHYQPKQLDEQSSISQWTRSLEPGIGVLVIDGPISYDINRRGFYAQNIDGVIEQLALFEKDEAVKALIVRINSPGGTVGASQELFHAIEVFKQRTGLPVVVSIADMCASGAYWVSLAADQIFANPGSLVGSIGVIMQQLDLADVKDKYGVGMRTVKSGQYKDILSSWREPSESETLLVQQLIADVHDQFKLQVQTSRQLPETIVNQLTQGQVFTGVQAKSYGLIDQIGGFKQAIIFTANQVGLSDDPRLIYRVKPSVGQWLQQWGVQSPLLRSWSLVQL